jgi:hypothetical protein
MLRFKTIQMWLLTEARKEGKGLQEPWIGFTAFWLLMVGWSSHQSKAQSDQTNQS